MAARLTMDPRNAAFVSRLSKASEQAKVPPLHHGRLVWMHERLGVSREAARKWFAGESMPRRGMLKNIANILQVDEAWLSLGVGASHSSESIHHALPLATTLADDARVDYDTAVDQLKLIVDRAVVGKSTFIDHNGQPQAVVVNFTEWQRLSSIPSLGRLLMEAPFHGDELASRSTVGLLPVDL